MPLKAPDVKGIEHEKTYEVSLLINVRQKGPFQDQDPTVQHLLAQAVMEYCEELEFGPEKNYRVDRLEEKPKPDDRALMIADELEHLAKTVRRTLVCVKSEREERSETLQKMAETIRTLELMRAKCEREITYG